MSKKLWGGRFSCTTDEQAAGFHSSIAFDSRLYEVDITGSIAHANMLGKTGIITEEDSEIIIEGLQDILSDIKSGNIEFNTDDEDIHMNIERLLTERIGEAGKKLHTGRSRNDQVALDTRMFVRQASEEVTNLIKKLMLALVGIRKKILKRSCPHTPIFRKRSPLRLRII